MNFIIWLILGALVGWIASRIMGTNRQQGFLMDMIIGIAGAYLGGFLGSFLGAGTSINDGFSIVGLITSVAGAVILLYAIGMIRGR